MDNRRIGDTLSLDHFRCEIGRIIHSNEVVGMGVVLIFKDGEGRTYQHGLDTTDFENASRAFGDWKDSPLDS